MNDYIDEVEQDPFGLLVAGFPKDSEIIFVRELDNFVGNGADLPVACAGSDDEVIGSRAFTCKVKDYNVSAVSFEGDFSRLNGEFFCV